MSLKQMKQNCFKIFLMHKSEVTNVSITQAVIRESSRLQSDSATKMGNRQLTLYLHEFLQPKKNNNSSLYHVILKFISLQFAGVRD